MPRCKYVRFASYHPLIISYIVTDSTQLDIQIKDHGGEVVIHEEPAAFPPIEQFTHIISSTADFPAYQSACDVLIPVVKPQWLQSSISKNKLANPRQFSPDPKMFFSDVVVTCGDIPDGDKDAIIGGVMAMGGLYSPKINYQVTHLVDLSMDSDKAKLVTAKCMGVKIVLPHWYGVFSYTLSPRTNNEN